MKPDHAIFEHVIDDLGLPPREVLFVDDNEMNVAGAAQAGLSAEVARGVEQARSVLDSYGVFG